MTTMTIGPYEVNEIIGRGAMGVVHAGVHTLTRRDVAIKLLREEQAANEDILRRFSTEGRSLGRVVHPHVVRVFDAGLTPVQRPYVVMERLRGASLAARLTSHARLSARETLRLARTLVGALSAVHEAGVVHCDVKPGNLIDAARGWTLLDFGIAKLSDAGAPYVSEGLVIGTPKYMSPEQVEAKEIGPWSDVWSMGVVLYRCLAGRLPFFGRATTEVFDKIRAGARPPLDSLTLPGVPTELIEAVEQCLEVDPGTRLRSTEELRELLDNVEPETCTAGSPRAIARAPKAVPVPGALLRRRDSEASERTVAMSRARLSLQRSRVDATDRLLSDYLQPTTRRALTISQRGPRAASTSSRTAVGLVKRRRG